MPHFQKGDVRIGYEETGSGFPLLVTPGGGLNSRISNWPTAVINAMEAFRNRYGVFSPGHRTAITHDRACPHGPMIEARSGRSDHRLRLSNAWSAMSIGVSDISRRASWRQAFGDDTAADPVAVLTDDFDDQIGCLQEIDSRAIAVDDFPDQLFVFGHGGIPYLNLRACIGSRAPMLTGRFCILAALADQNGSLQNCTCQLAKDYSTPPTGPQAERSPN